MASTGEIAIRSPSEYHPSAFGCHQIATSALRSNALLWPLDSRGQAAVADAYGRVHELMRRETFVLQRAPCPFPPPPPSLPRASPVPRPPSYVRPAASPSLAVAAGAARSHAGSWEDDGASDTLPAPANAATADADAHMTIDASRAVGTGSEAGRADTSGVLTVFGGHPLPTADDQALATALQSAHDDARDEGEAADTPGIDAAWLGLTALAGECHPIAF